jgi:hypothetical protein
MIRSMRGVVVACLAVFLAAMFTGRSSTSPGTALRIAAVAPFSVQGSGFRAQERVQVVAKVRGRHVKAVRATATGTFRVRFLGVSATACTGYVVRAIGNKGSRAYLRHVPECADP